MFAALLLALAVPLLPGPASAAAPDVAWVEGPRTVDLGTVAQVKLPDGYMFANAADAKKLMEYMQNPPGDELGLIAPTGGLDDWFIIFEFRPVGYVKDDERADLDAGAIFQTIKKGTEASNKWRQERGFPPFNLVGWYEEPRYDTRSHNLVWATRGESTGDEVINYNTRLLGRRGYMSAILVADPPTLDAAKSRVEQVVAGFSWKSGQNYAEWVPGDRVAEVGLTALIAGGAGAAAVKTGLLAKIWKLLLVGASAVGVAAWRIVKRTVGGRSAA